MSWIQKRITPAVVGANRANSSKSTGPRTAIGKRQVSRNAGKYYVFGQITPSRMRELGEDPSEFEKLRQSLRNAIGPRDGFEEILVEEMTSNRWRLARLRRAETAILVNQRERVELHIRYPQSQRQASSDNLIISQFGLAGLTDSPQKYRQILELLQSLQAKVEKEGFTPDGLKLLKTVFGDSPPVTGVSLISQFEGQLRNLDPKTKTADGKDTEFGSESESVREQAKEARDRFLTSLLREFQTFTTFYEAVLQLRTTPIPDSVKEALLILPEADSERIMRYEAMLQREFERVQKQFLDWRNRQKEAPNA